MRGLQIEERTKKVWFSPLARKHYQTKKAACYAEARAAVERKYPSEPYERDTGAGWSWREDERLCRLVFRVYRRLMLKLNDNKGKKNGS